MGSPVPPVIANMYLEHFQSLAIATSPTLIKWWFTYVYYVHSVIKKDQVKRTSKAYQLHRSMHQIHHRTPCGTDGLPFLDTLTKPTPNSIESTVYRYPPIQMATYTTTLNTPSQQNYLLSTPSSTELNKYVLT